MDGKRKKVEALTQSTVAANSKRSLDLFQRQQEERWCGGGGHKHTHTCTTQHFRCHCVCACVCFTDSGSLMSSCLRLAKSSKSGKERT